MERWDNRLTLKNLHPSEEYIKRRLSIICDLIISGTLYRSEFFALVDKKRKITKGTTAIVFPINPSKRHNVNIRDQEAVLVHDVELVKSPQGVIPSLVWFYRVQDQVENLSTGRLYFSSVHDGYEFMPGFSNSELSPLIGSITRQADDFTRHEVEGGTQIVNAVSNNERHIKGQFLGCLELDSICSIRILLDKDTMGVSLKEGIDKRIQLTDVLIGPFDL